MKNKKMLVGIAFLFAFTGILISCQNSGPKPVENYVTITVIDGTGGGQFKVNENVTITANNKEGYAFKEWTVDNNAVSTENPYTFKATKDETYTATYNQINTVTIEVINGTGSGTYKVGDTVTVSPILQEGDSFIKWMVKGEKISDQTNYSFKAESDLIIKADILRGGDLAKASQTLTMNGDEFTILNLTDIQLHDNNTVDFTKYIIDSCIAYKKPDLITILGDIINDFPGVDAKIIPVKIFELIESYNIPWAPLFGNHDQKGLQDPTMSGKTIGSEELKAMLEDKTKYPHCLYLPGPDSVHGLSNYMIHIEDEYGHLKESLILFDSLKYGLDDTHIKFYEDCIKYTKDLNDGTKVPTVVFDHIPLPQYVNEYNKFIVDDLRGVNGCCGSKPIANSNREDLFSKFIEYGSTKTMLCGHDHFNSYYTELEGIKLGYAMKSSVGDDEGGNPYKFLMGGCYLTIDGENEDRIEYHPTNDYEYEVVAGVKNGFDYHFSQVVDWKGSGAKLKFKIRLPDSGSVRFDLSGTNMRNGKGDEATGSWNRLTDYVTINASNKTVSKGTLTPIDEEGLYLCEVDLMDFELNEIVSEKAYGDETARLVHFNNNDMTFKISNIHMEFEEILETDQIDLNNATIDPIEDQLYQKGKVVKPDIKVKLNGKELKQFDDYVVRYKNNIEIGTATVEVTPSGKGAHIYKGMTTTTFEIGGNPYRGEAFTNGFEKKFDPTIPLTEELVFDVHFTSGSETTLWFMLGDGWDDYFGYYGIKATGVLSDTYSGISIYQVEDDFIRVVCDLDELVTVHSSKVPTEKINMFFIHSSWGDTPTGYIDFDLSDAPSVVRGEKFNAGVDKEIRFDKIESTETVIIDFKFISGRDTSLFFFIGNNADWDKYYGYYKLFSNGSLSKTDPGISITTTDDGYTRLTLDLDNLNTISEKGAPDPEKGFTLFYIRGAWTDGEGYVDFNPTLD